MPSHGVGDCLMLKNGYGYSCNHVTFFLKAEGNYFTNQKRLEKKNGL
jgi:hypothetical protein